MNKKASRIALWIILGMLGLVAVWLAGLYFVNRSFPKQLTSTGKDFSPLCSPDGEKIAFLRKNFNLIAAETPQELWIMDSDGSHQEAVLLHGKPIITRVVQWLPNSDGFLCCLNSGLWQVSLDGRAKELKKGILNFQCSPNGTRIAFLTLIGLYPEPLLKFSLRVINNDGTHGQSLATGPITYYAWAGDNRNLIYSLYDRKASNYDLWELSVDSKTTRRICATPASEEQPACSPDGKYIVYVVGGTQRDLYITPRNSFKPRKLMSNAFGPCWVNGGKLLQVSYEMSKTGPNGKSFWTESKIIDLNGKTVKEIGKCTPHDLNFFPDGHKYVYSEHGNIYLDRL